MIVSRFSTRIRMRYSLPGRGTSVIVSRAIENHRGLRRGACMGATAGIELVCLIVMVINTLARRIAVGDYCTVTGRPGVGVPRRIIKLAARFR